MKTIQDLIEVPEVETVVQVSALKTCDENSRKRRFVDTFVITDDILTGLHAIASALGNDTGTGFLLKGGYGSGKSHFIAFVASLLFHPHLISDIPSLKGKFPDINKITSRPILPVVLTLTDYPATSGLSEVIIDAISEALVAENLRNPIADSAGVADDFARIMLPGLKDRFDEYLRKHGMSHFESASQFERNTLVLGFLKDCNIPFRPHYNYRKLFESIDAIANEKFPGGIFLLVDELSEFLRSRSRQELISEDIRFIQFLGEHASRTRFWALFSMQEAIEEVADITTEGLNRVKDRYPVRINLTAFHLRELVEKRLLKKKEHAFRVIDEIHALLLDAFPQLKISREEFRAIYPIHPATFAMLESIAGLFSKARGLVDFIVTEIAGDPNRGIAGMLGDSANTLLLPDRIFDHFRNNLQESVQYNRMVSVIFNAIERAAASHFKKGNDVSVALRAAKLIVLHQILPDKKSPSALELANLLVENRFQIDPAINYSFMRDKILKGLEQIWPFLRCERGATPLEDRFYLTGEESPLNRFEKTAQQFLQTVPNAEKQALWFFISRMRDDEIPLGEIKSSDRSARLQFENTMREGMVFLKDPSAFSNQDIDALKFKLTRSESDFAIIIGFPSRKREECERFREICASITPPLCDSVFFWQPREADNQEQQALKGHFARLRVAENEDVLSEDKSVRERIEESKKEGTRIIKSLYAEGSVFSFIDGAVKQHDLLFTNSFDKTVELFTRDSLKRIFSGHSKIMPTVPISSPETYHQIIMLFSEKSEIDFNFEGSRLLKNAVDSILKNSGLLAIVQSQYKISPDPSKNAFLKDLLTSIDSAAFSFEELYFQFRKGKYGIQKDLFCLYLFFLTAAGYITLKRAGRTLRPSSLDLRTIQSAEEILTGEELSALFVEKYHLLGTFAEGLKPKNIHLQAQESVWDRLVTFKRLEEDRISELLEKLNALERLPVFGKNPLSSIRSSLQMLLFFLKNIKTGKSAKDGLNQLFEALPEDINIENDLAVAKRFEHFVNVDADQIVYMYNYITSPELHLGESEELKNEVMSLLERIRDIDALVAGGMVESFIQNFLAFREEYKHAYQTAHLRIHPPNALAEYEALRLTPAYRVLTNLHLIEPIAVENDIVVIERTLLELNTALCRRPIQKELNEKPYCECRLKRSDTGITPEKIRSMIHRGIEEYFAALKSDDIAAKISSFCGLLLSSGEKDKRDALKSFYEIDPAATSETDLLRIVTRETALLCNRALSTNTQLIEKNIEELVHLFEGRRGGKADFVRIFSEWLERDIPHDREIVFYITGARSASRKALLPDIAMDALRKEFPGKSDDVILKALALFFISSEADEDKSISLISKLLHVEVTGKAMRQFLENHSDFISSDTNWEELFDTGELSEVIAALDLDNASNEKIAEIYNASKGFPSIRTDIVAKLLNNIVTFSSKDESFFKADNSIHGELISSIIRLKTAQKNYLRESARSDEFNGPVFRWAFETMHLAERIHQISINQNIAPDRIASPALALKQEAENSCAHLFSGKITEWENDVTAKISALHDFIHNVHTPLILLFDAMRYDLFLAVLPFFEKSGWKHKKLSFYLAPLPSDTRAFREALFPHIELVNGIEFEYLETRYIFLSAAEREYKREELISLLEANPDTSIILSIGLLDEKIHGTSQSTGSLALELSLFCEQMIVPLLNSVASQRDIIIMNDHGFIEHQNYAQKSEPRYSHGGNSFQERIVFASWHAKNRRP